MDATAFDASFARIYFQTCKINGTLILHFHILKLFFQSVLILGVKEIKGVWLGHMHPLLI